MKLKFTIPLLGLALSVAIIAFQYVSISADLTQREIRHALTTLSSTANTLQGNLNSHLKRNNMVGVRQAISEVNFQPLADLVYLLDETDSVIASSELGMVGKMFIDVPHGIDVENLGKVRSRMTSDIVKREGGTHLIATFPVIMGFTVGELRPSRIGVGIIHFDLTASLASLHTSARRTAMNTSLVVAGILLLAGGCLHFLLTKRVNRILRSADSYMQGNKETRVSMKGRDELASIAKAFDSVADGIAEANDELERSESQLRGVFEGVADGILSFDEGGRITTFNPVCERMFGYSAFAATSMTIEDICDSRSAGMFLKSSDKDGLGECRGLRRDGSVFDMEVSVNTVEVDQALKTIAIVRDVTERKQLENMKSEFISIVSHELRTPITSIQGSLKLISGGAAGTIPDQAHMLIETCIRNSDRLQMLINDILDMDKIVAGDMPFEFESVASGDLLSSALSLNSGFANKGEVSISIENRTESTVLADARRIQQVFANLISNAIKYSKPGDIITLSAENRNGMVRYNVIDGGPGIPQQYVEKVFERFFQVENSDTRNVQGTGLGLAISREIVKKHGGQIGVDSQLDIGTTFWFELPLATPHQIPVLAKSG